METIMRHGGWKNDKSAKVYIEDSVENKARTVNMITNLILGSCAIVVTSVVDSSCSSVDTSSSSDACDTSFQYHHFSKSQSTWQRE